MAEKITEKKFDELLDVLDRISENIDILASCVYTRKHDDGSEETYFRISGDVNTWEQNR